MISHRPPGELCGRHADFAFEPRIGEIAPLGQLERREILAIYEAEQNVHDLEIVLVDELRGQCGKAGRSLDVDRHQQVFRGRLLERIVGRERDVDRRIVLLRAQLCDAESRVLLQLVLHVDVVLLGEGVAYGARPVLPDAGPCLDHERLGGSRRRCGKPDQQHPQRVITHGSPLARIEASNAS
jgi:hypothetical protein